MSIRKLDEILAGLPRGSAAELAERLRQRLRCEPACPVAHYLLACHCLDRGRPAQAVRHMMTAHRVEPAFESAALLVFAGLNWLARRRLALLPVLLDTWEEFRRPEFDRTRAERRLLDAFAEPLSGLHSPSLLARRLWRLPLRSLRAQLRAAVASPNVAQRTPLLATPA